MYLLPGETLVSSHSGNNYDLGLVQLAGGNYRLVVFMKIQFFFEDSNGLKWGKEEKQRFTQQWQEAVRAKWGNRVLKNLGGGKQVMLEFRFKTQIGGVMWDHWEITVKLIPKSSFLQSYVRDGFINNVSLDSEDLSMTPKGEGQSQRGVVHEFGHMLGLEDEYTSNSAYKTDYRSIMNRGETVLMRHDAYFLKWLDAQLQEKAIQ